MAVHTAQASNQGEALQGPPNNQELQYITQCVAGTLFGGWYRILQDERIELLALGGIWRAPRCASLPQRQARAMLARLVRLRGGK